MIPTPRALRVAGLLLAASLVVAAWSPLQGWIWILDLVFLGLCLFDFARTPSPARLSVQRRVPERAGLSQDFARVLRVEAAGAPGARGLRLELHERFPPAFEVRARSALGAPAFEAAGANARGERTHGLQVPAAGDPSGGPDITLVPASGPIDLVRLYRAERRGLHELGDLRLRLRGRLGLFERQARLRGAQSLRIEPPLLDLARTLRLAASERWRDLGVRTLRRRGGMTEFESLRELVRGDDVRLVDWKASARRGKPIVREYQEERGQELMLVFDCGRRMSATSSEDAQGTARLRGWTKLDHALDAGLQIAAVALQEGDRVGVLAFDDKLRVFVPPGKRSDQLARLKEAVFGLQPSAREADLERALRELALRHRRRALILLFTDVADPLSVARQRAALAAGARQHRILFAGLDDPALRAAVEGRIAAPAPVRAAAWQLVAERERGLAELRGAGVRVLDTLPAEAAGPLLAAWLEARREL